MSYAGHVFDMIKRSKELRDRKNLRRDRTKERQKKFVGSGLSTDITAEEFERIERQIKERETEQRSKTSRMMFVILAILILVVLSLYAIFSLFIS